MLEERLHTCRRHLLHAIGVAQRVELLTPLVDLGREIDLDGTNIVARHTERACRAVVVVGIAVLEHTEIDADGAWDEVGVGISSGTTIDGTSVHAGAATHTLERLPMLGIAEDAAATVIDEDDMHLGTRTRLAEMRGIDRGGLACAMTCEEALEYAHGLVVGDDLLKADGDNMELGDGGAHVGVAFVGADYNVARLGDAEVATGHTAVGMHEVVAQVIAGSTGEIGGVGAGVPVVAFLQEAFGSACTMLLDDALLAEAGGHLLAGDVDGGHHDVAGRYLHELKDALAKVGLDHVDAVLNEVVVQMALFGEHRLALNHLLDVVLTHDLHDDVVVFVGIFCPMHMHAILLGIGLELLQIVGQMGDGVPLDEVGRFAQLLPLFKLISEAVTLGTHTPECLVVAGYSARILIELLGSYTVFGTHNIILSKTSC